RRHHRAGAAPRAAVAHPVPVPRARALRDAPAPRTRRALRHGAATGRRRAGRPRVARAGRHTDLRGPRARLRRHLLSSAEACPMIDPLDRRYETHPRVMLTEMSDGTGVLLHLDTKFYYTLNRSGTKVWKTLGATGGDARAACAAVVT